MLQISNTYKEAILELDHDPQIFPVSPLGKWSSPIGFNSSFADLKFGDLYVTMVSPMDRDDRQLVPTSSVASQLTNLTPGNTSSLITSNASSKLTILSKAGHSTEVLNALAMQLQNETDGASSAMVLQPNLTQAQIDAMIVAGVQIDVGEFTQLEIASTKSGTIKVFGSKSTKVKSETPKGTKIKEN